MTCLFKVMFSLQGSVTASVTTIDFDDVDSVLSAPGDLTVLDQEGETQPLTTYGTFCRLYFKLS